jgi:hypothetical protein
MYIINKGKVNKKGNKRNCFWLVESVRIGGKSKSRNLLYLGNIDIAENERATLGKLIERKIKEMPLTCKFSEKLETMSDDAVKKYNLKWDNTSEISEKNEKSEYVELDLNSLDHSQSRTAGSETIALEFWKRLGFSQVFENAGLNLNKLIAPKQSFLEDLSRREVNYIHITG